MSPPAPGLTDDLIATAVALADIARATTLAYFRRPIDVVRKEDSSPVTIADRETERRMRELITERHRDHGIVGEEFGVHEGASEWSWVLDPIDGTKSFVSGKPIFGSLVALLRDQAPVLGVIEIPCQEERWIGIRGQQTMFNGVPCAVSTTAHIDEAVMLATTPDMFGATDWPVFERVSRQARARAFGTDCYGYGLLASGFSDAVMEADLKPYDYLALLPIIEGAGGVISDWNGAPLGIGSDGRVLASATRALHDDILARITAAA
jgi:inositol-phosphate phosphatase/L-galactose 1-phosphate phosphatase/histidinol-phosphatase